MPRSRTFAIVPTLLAACASGSVSGDPQVESSLTVSLPIDAHKLRDALVDAGVTRKADAFAMLPEQLKTHFVLVTSTGGLGRASRARPRPAHFTEDARFILASSGSPAATDPTANAFEILDFDDAQGVYHAHTLEIGNAGVTLIEDDARCVRCHGKRAQPIWTDYATWPQAYGGSLGFAGVDEMTTSERADFAAFVATAATDPDYRHLEIHPTQKGFYLPTAYGYPNTLFTARLGVRQASTLAKRLAQSPDVPELENALAALLLSCTIPTDIDAWISQRYASRVASDPELHAAQSSYPATRTWTKVYRLLGIEPSRDLQPGVPVGGATPSSFESEWNAGGDYLHKLAAFPQFAALVASDPVLGAAFASVRPRIDAIAAAFELDAVTLEHPTSMSYFDTAFPFLHYNVEYPILNAATDSPPGEGRRAAVCGHLVAMQRAAQQ